MKEHILMARAFTGRTSQRCNVLHFFNQYISFQSSQPCFMKTLLWGLAELAEKIGQD